MAEKATAAVEQPLALADRNAGREGLAATRGHGEAMTEGSRLVAFAASALAMKPFGRAMRAPTSKTVAWWDVGADGPGCREAFQARVAVRQGKRLLGCCGRFFCHRQRFLAGHIGPHPPQAGKTPESCRKRRLGAMFLFIACLLRRGAVYCAQEG